MVRNEQFIQNLKASGKASKPFPLHCWSIALINSGTLTSPSYKPTNQADSLFKFMYYLCIQLLGFTYLEIAIFLCCCYGACTKHFHAVNMTIFDAIIISSHQY